MRIHGKIFIGDDVYLENDYPEAVEIQEGATIGLRSIIVAHTRGAGEVVIEKDAALGAGCIVTTVVGRRLVIGRGAVVGAGTVVSKNVPPGVLFTSPRADAVADVTVPFTQDTSYGEFLRGLRPRSSLKRPALAGGGPDGAARSPVGIPAGRQGTRG